MGEYKIEWSDHAKERAKQRFQLGGTGIQKASEQARYAMRKGEFDEYREDDRRELGGRIKGHRINIVVRAEVGAPMYLVMRHVTWDRLIVVSVLTPAQFRRNQKRQWVPKKVQGVPVGRRAALTHSPMAAAMSRLLRKKERE